jgi:Tfp pilus assembly protein PilN
MAEKITIIEGPTPEFREVNGLWIQGVAESPGQFNTYYTELRAFDGFSLVDRCSAAWQRNDSVVLEYRTETGLTDEITVIAAHSEETDDGDLLQLWVRQPREDMEFELNFDEGDDEEDFL